MPLCSLAGSRLLILLALATPTLTAVQAQDAALSRLEPAFAAVEPRVIAWRRDFHEHPELGNRETRTASVVAGHLRGLGLEVRTGVAHTGVIGVLRGGRPGPVVALRADMDALPVTERNELPFRSRAVSLYNGAEVGVSHACGHDAHVAMLMGAAEVLAGMQAELAGTVVFLFQPAEEGPPVGEDGGAELMVAEGALRNPAVEAIFGLHIASDVEAGHVEYRSGGTYASVDDFKITVRGRQTHGAYPWQGVDPIVASAHIITALQTIVSRSLNLPELGPGIVTVGSIHGGLRSNIIPESVEMVGTIRALDPAARTLLHERIRAIATNVAESMGATADVLIPMSVSYPVTVNDPALTASMVAALEAAAPGRVSVAAPATGAEDFAFFAQAVPGFYFNVGGRPPSVRREDAASHHTPDFLLDESGFATGVRALTAVALEYMRQHSPGAGR